VEIFCAAASEITGAKAALPRIFPTHPGPDPHHNPAGRAPNSDSRRRSGR